MEEGKDGGKDEGTEEGKEEEVKEGGGWSRWSSLHLPKRFV